MASDGVTESRILVARRRKRVFHVYEGGGASRRGRRTYRRVRLAERPDNIELDIANCFERFAGREFLEGGGA